MVVMIRLFVLGCLRRLPVVHMRRIPQGQTKSKPQPSPSIHHHQVGKGVTAAKDAVYGVADAAGSVAEQLQGVAASGEWHRIITGSVRGVFVAREGCPQNTRLSTVWCSVSPCLGLVGGCELFYLRLCEVRSPMDRGREGVI